MIERETACACALNRIFGYEPRAALALVNRYGSAAAVFERPAGEIDGLLGPFSKYKGMVDKSAPEKEERELEWLEGLGCRFLPYTHPDYPKLLKECEDPPAGLYYKSASSPAEIFGASSYIAVVGTRDASPYGREWCERIVKALAQAPIRPVIVSGLAFGIDVTAHRAALESGLPTIAVLPNGIDDIYPRAHQAIAGDIALTPGCALVTDYPPGTGPVAFTFLRRNRIIAALSGATILVESKAHGGGLITCGLASGYGREVYALPGRIDDFRSAGCNALIAEKTAEAIVNLAGLGAQLGLGRYNLRKGSDLAENVGRRYSALPEEERSALLRLAMAVRSNRGASLDELCRLLGMPYSEVAGLAGVLEGDGIICTDLMQRCTINAKFD